MLIFFEKKRSIEECSALSRKKIDPKTENSVIEQRPEDLRWYRNQWRFELSWFNSSLRCSTSEAVKGATPSFEGVHDVEGCHRLSARELSVGNGISDGVLKKNFEYAFYLLVDEAWDALDATSSGKTTNCRLRYAFDVVSDDPSVSIGTAFA